MQSIHIRVPDEIHEALREESFTTRRSMNSLITEAWKVRQAANIIRCEHDWTDGGCTNAAPIGTAGWEQREGRRGDMYWMCPDCLGEAS